MESLSPSWGPSVFFALWPASFRLLLGEKLPDSAFLLDLSTFTVEAAAGETGPFDLS